MRMIITNWSGSWYACPNEVNIDIIKDNDIVYIRFIKTETGEVIEFPLNDFDKMTKRKTFKRNNDWITKDVLNQAKSMMRSAINGILLKELQEKTNDN